MLNIICGKAGTGKTEYIINSIYKISDFDNLILIIPDQESFEYEKKLYNKLGADVFNNIKIYTFSKLAQLIIDEYGNSEGVYADDITKLILMNSALKEVQKNETFLFYQKQHTRSSFALQSLEIIKEMHWSNITEEDLTNKSQISSMGILSDKIADISAISLHYNQLLKSHGYKDSLNNFNEASGLLSKNMCFANKVIFIDGFNSFSADEYKLLESIITSSSHTYITLTMDTKNISYTHKNDIFTISNNTFNNLINTAKSYNIEKNIIKLEEYKRFKNTELSNLLDNLFINNYHKITSENHVHLLEAEDIYKEVDYVAAKIRKLIVDDGAKYSDIAVIADSLEDYESIIDSAFSRYYIEYFMDKESDILHKTLVLFIMSIFDMIIQKKPDTETIIRLLKTGFIKVKNSHDAMDYISFYDISILENFCYQWNVKGDMWKTDFPDNIHDSGKSNAIRKSIIEPILNLKKDIQKNSTVKNICVQLIKYFDYIELKETINYRYSVENKEDSEEFKIARETRQIWNTVMSVLDTMYTVIGEEEISAKEFKDIFGMLISSCGIQNPPQTIDSVLIGELYRCNLNEPKYLFILAANEGRFPNVVNDTGLINQREKEQLKNLGINFTETIERKIDEGRFKAYTALSSASNDLYISFHKSGISGTKGHPSYLFTKIADLYESKHILQTSEIGLDFYTTTRHAVYYNYIQEYNRQNVYTNSLYNFLNNDNEFKGKIEYLQKTMLKTSDTITDKDIIKKIFKDNKLIVSASRFEDFNICRFKYFCKKVLNLYSLTKMELSPLEKGNIIHKCLHDLLSENKLDDFLNLSEIDLENIVSEKLETYYKQELQGDFGKTHRFVSIYKSYTDTITGILIHMQEELQQSSFVPVEFELKIPTENISEPIRIVSKDGIEIEFQGAVDRVDAYNSDDKRYIRIIDYKTGKKTFSYNDVFYGLNMQMLLYLFALTQGTNSKYKDYNPAGILYMPSKDPECNLSRNPSEKDILKQKNSIYKMNGLVLDNEKVIKAMENSINGAYIPVSKNKDGSFSKSSMVISPNQIKNLRKYCYNMLKKMAEQLYSGEISANPISSSKSSSPCDFCEYKDICGDVKTKLYDKNAENAMLDILNENNVEVQADE